MFSKIYSVFLGFVTLTFLAPGVYLIALGGTFYYLIAGGLLLGSSVLLFRGQSTATTLLAIVIFYTLLWATWEVGIDFWSLSIRIYFVSLLGLVLLLKQAFSISNRPDLKLPVALLSVSLLASIVLTWFSYNSFVEGLVVSAETFTSRDRHSANSAHTATDWAAYGNTGKGTKYSPLDEINTTNIDSLEVAWHVRTGVGYTFKNTPLQVDDKLYACGGGNVILALDAETGDELWRFDAEIKNEIISALTYFTTTCRGVSYYEAPPEYSGECPRRILMGTTDARLMAVDADTGRRCTSFGKSGEIDLKKDMGEVKELFYFVTSAPAIVRGNAVLGGWVADNREIKEPSGVIRAFDAITGGFAWAWDMGRPDDQGEPTDGAIYTRGTPNVWSLFSVDEERGMVFAPMGNETPDYYGALRHEASEKFASSVVALNGETGELIWSFQAVHHDIWDYDVPAQPVLIDLPNKAGALIPAVVQVTKQGEVFLLNRLTGKPIAPVEERPVPQGGVAEDWTAATQPFSAMPNVLGEPLDETDMWGITPFDHLWCRMDFLKLRYEGLYTPPSTVPTLQYPGNAGGYNWGGVSVDEERHIMVGNLMVLANKTRLVPRNEFVEGAGIAPQSGTPYGIQAETYMSPLFIPCTSPPFGMLVALDLQNQDLLWQRPIGTGAPLLAGTITTAGGLVFLGGSMDGFLRAIDTLTGAELWQFQLPATGQAAPMTYLSPISKRQTVIMTVPEADQTPGGASEGDGQGGHIIAFRLPAEAR